MSSSFSFVAPVMRAMALVGSRYSRLGCTLASSRCVLRESVPSVTASGFFWLVVIDLVGSLSHLRVIPYDSGFF